MATTARVRAPKSSLTAKDHTTLVNLVMEDPQHFARALGVRELQKQSPRFATTRVLEALLEMPRLSPAGRRKIEEAMVPARALEEAQIRIPATVRRTLNRIHAETRAASAVRGKRAVLRRLLDDPAVAGEEGIARGVRVAIELLDDGAATIYSARHPFYRQITAPSPRPLPQQGTSGGAPGTGTGGGGSGSGTGGGGSGGGTGGSGSGGGSGGAGGQAEDIGDADVRGAIEGSAAGYLTGLQIGGEIGAMVGSDFAGLIVSVASSTSAIGKKFSDWLFG